MQIEDDQKVRKFLGEPIVLDLENPVAFGPSTKPDFFMEHKRAQLEEILQAEKKILETGAEFEKNFEKKIWTRRHRICDRLPRFNF